MYLHKGFRIVTCPLFKTTALRKTTQLWKWWSSCNPMSSLIHCKEVYWKKRLGIPAVNIIKNPICFCAAVDWYQVFLDPRNQVILEGALDELMKNVWGNKTMDIGTRKVICKRLFIRWEFIFCIAIVSMKRRTTISPTRPYSSQRTPNSRLLTSSSVWSRDRRPPPPSRSSLWAVHLSQRGQDHKQVAL